MAPTWVNDHSLLADKVKDILVGKLGFVFGPEEADLFFNQHAVEKYWTRVFTHRSIDPNGNYEDLEFFGDKTLNYVFPMYIHYYFEGIGENLTRDKATLFMNKYMSGGYQAKLSDTLGLPDLVWIDSAVEDIPRSLREDLFEAFVGAVNNIVNDHYGMLSVGVTYAYNIIVALFKDVPLSIEAIKRPARSQLKEIMDKLHRPELTFKFVPSDKPSKGRSMVVIYSDVGDVVGRGYGDHKDDATDAASLDALQRLEKRGITRETVNKIQMKQRAKTNAEFQYQYERAEKAVDEYNAQVTAKGKYPIESFYVKTDGSIKGKNGHRYIFVFEAMFDTAKGKKYQNLVTATGDTDWDAKIGVLKKFADYLKVPA